MHLYFLRHGVAEDAAPGQSDASRKLTESGRVKMRKEAEFLARLDLKLDAVYSSPYPRASETAGIVQEIAQFPDVLEDKRLASGVFGLGELQAIAAGKPFESRLLFVGHEPDLSGLIQILCGATIDMKKGALACLEVSRLESHGGVLRWLLPPAVMRVEE